MKILGVLLFITVVLLAAPMPADANDFSLKGHVEMGYYHPGNEYDAPGNALPYVARYALRANVRAQYKRVFVFYNPDVYFGNNMPGQCNCDYDQSYEAPFLVYYQNLGAGVQLTKNTELYVEHGETFWPDSETGQGDRYLYTGIFLRYNFDIGGK